MKKKETILTGTLLFFIFTVISLLTPVQSSAERKIVRLACADWSEAVATTNMAKTVIEEKFGYQCRIISMTADKMWESVATGKVDGMLAAWLPTTHAHYHKKFKDQLVDLGPNIIGTQIGLVIPDITVGRQTASSGARNAPYIKAESIADLKKYSNKFGRKIIGIDSEAGIMKKTREAMREYELYDYELVEGSEVSMTAELSNAIRKQRWIVVTGWEPHWIFGRWTLKFLDDPKNIFGGKETIHTMVRQGLKEDMPDVYRFLDNFNWKKKELEQLMIWIQEDKGMYPREKAQRYMRYHPDQIKSWLE